MANPTEQNWIPGKSTVRNFDYVRSSDTLVLTSSEQSTLLFPDVGDYSGMLVAIDFVARSWWRRWLIRLASAGRVRFERQ